MALFISSITGIILGFVFLAVFKEPGFFRSIAVIMMFAGYSVLTIGLGNYLLNSQLHKHVRGRK